MPICTTVAIASPSRSSWSGSKSPSAAPSSSSGSTASSSSSCSSGSPWRRQWSVSFSISSSAMKAPCDTRRARLARTAEQHVALPEQRLRAVLVEDHARIGLDETAKAIRAAGTFALIMPVITSALGRWVASTRWMPTARDFCASRMIESSTSAGATDHQVGELVDHAEDVRQRRLALLHAHAVQLDQAARLGAAHHAVALLHLLDQVARARWRRAAGSSRPASSRCGMPS